MDRLYCLHDYDLELKKKGAFVVTPDQAERLNKKGYGVFFEPNTFKGARRKENLVKIKYWLADMDDGTKEEQMNRIDKIRYKPSIIVETKKGYHCYWAAIDATKEKYRTIEKGLIAALKADKGCKDMTRLLRVPGFYHMKDKDSPYLIKIIWKRKDEYREAEMLFGFPVPVVKSKTVYTHNNSSDFLNPEKWNHIFKLNQIGKGSRNNELTRIIFWLKDEGISGSDIQNAIYEMNNKLSESLSSYEIRSLLRGKI